MIEVVGWEWSRGMRVPSSTACMHALPAVLLLHTYTGAGRVSEATYYALLIISSEAFVLFKATNETIQSSIVYS